MLSKEDKEFLKTYKAEDYERPSVTVDMLIFTVIEDLSVMLIKRKNPPYKDKWAIPGGFLDVSKKESIYDAAKRELKEETNVDCYMEQFKVFGDVDRDPRTRVISVAHLALVPFSKIHNAKAGDDAKEVQFFDIDMLPELAFDHKQIIKEGLKSLREKLEYTDIAFNLLNEEFTISDIQDVYEMILRKELDKSNFRRMIKSKFNLEETGKVQKKYQRPAKLYRRVK